MLQVADYCRRHLHILFYRLQNRNCQESSIQHGSIKYGWHENNLHFLEVDVKIEGTTDNEVIASKTVVVSFIPSSYMRNCTNSVTILWQPQEANIMEWSWVTYMESREKTKKQEMEYQKC